MVVTTIILRLPVSDLNRCVEDFVIGRKALTQSRIIVEQFERRARLAPRLYGAIELAPRVASAADHRHYGAVWPHCDERGLTGILLGSVRGQCGLHAILR